MKDWATFQGSRSSAAKKAAKCCWDGMEIWSAAESMDTRHAGGMLRGASQMQVFFSQMPGGRIGG